MVSDDRRAALGIELNDGQARARDEIEESISAFRQHLLTGHAGSGKTTLLQILAATKRRERIVLTAPTHKAVSVLARKLKVAGITANCQTNHKLLSLRPEARGDRLVFTRHKHAKPVEADIVIIDECSMLDETMMENINEYLPGRAVIFCGDPAQLPPVNEKASQSFDVTPRSHLDTIVRQEAHNPILHAAGVIRESQGHPMDWSWCESANKPPLGLFRPSDPIKWMKRGFLSDQFSDDPDSFRYLCWKNETVGKVNAMIRQWIYGDNIPTPFMPGEMALMRAPVIIGDEIVVNTNEEVEVLSIEPSEHRKVPTWGMEILCENGQRYIVHRIKDRKVYLRELKVWDAYAREKNAWESYHDFKQSFITAQSIYALTTHNSQGSTFRNVFMDVGDLRRRLRTNRLEAQQLFYVAATRPSHALILIDGADVI